jgi:hypothetical protein
VCTNHRSSSRPMVTQHDSVVASHSAELQLYYVCKLKCKAQSKHYQHHTQQSQRLHESACALSKEECI